MIPACLLIDLLVFAVASVIDSSIASGNQGHPAPFVTMIAMLILAALTIFVVIYALVRCIQSLIREKKRINSENMNATTEPLPDKGEKKPAWHCFIPLFVEIPVSIVIVFLYGRKEINDFYSDPSHIGFAIPASTFAIAFILFLITIVLLVICIIAAVVRSKKNRQIENT